MARRTDFDRAVDALVPICTAAITTPGAIPAGREAPVDRIFAQRVQAATKRLSKADGNRAVVEAMRIARDANKTLVVDVHRRRRALKQRINRELRSATKPVDNILRREAVYKMQHKRPVKRSPTASGRSKFNVGWKSKPPSTRAPFSVVEVKKKEP